MSLPDLSSYVADIACIILGEPNHFLSTRDQLRFGSNGSIAVEISGPERGKWFDHENQIGGGVYQLIKIKDDVPDDQIIDWLKDHRLPYANGHHPPTAVYDYRDENGVLLFQVCRFDNPKTFLQRAANGTWKVKGIRKVPYRLPELIAAPTDQSVFIVEGEKDADCLARAGLVATTNPGGAAKRRDDGKPGKSKWLPEFNPFFVGRTVIIIPDNDDAGRDHARSIATNLGPIAKSVAILELPDLPQKGDVSDWLNAGGTIDQLMALASKAHSIEPQSVIDEAKCQAQLSGLGKLIERFNRQYAVVNEAGKVLVFEQIEDPILKRKVITRFTFPDFHKLYQNTYLTITIIDGNGKPRAITKTFAEWWLNHEDRRQYLAGVVCDPTCKVPATYWNLWTGFSVKPEPGDWSLLREHVRKVICSGNQDHFEFLMNTTARMFQYPAEQAEVAVVMRGDEGVGKGILMRYLVMAFGQHGMQITSSQHLVGNFNDHLHDCVMLFADEAFFAGDKQHEGRLKGLITENFMTVEGKFKAVVTIKNMLHVYMASNNDWVVPASMKARRWFMLDVPDTFRGNRVYFSKIVHQMEREGGLAAMIFDMLHRDISNFDPREIPNTEALRNQKAFSLKSLEQWWKDVLERGFLYCSKYGTPMFREWTGFYTTELLWNSYSQWCDQSRVYRRQTRVELGKFMTKLYQFERPRGEHPIYEIERIDIDPSQKHGNWLDEYAVVLGSHKPGYTVGELEESRVRFSDIYDIPTDWSDNSDQW